MLDLISLDAGAESYITVCSSKFDIPRAPLGGWCVRHDVMMWFADCFFAQFFAGFDADAISQLCTVAQKNPLFGLRWLYSSVSREWSLSRRRWLGFLARQARAIVAIFCLRFVGSMPASTVMLSVEVGRSQPVTVCNSSLMLVDKRMW